MKKLILLLLIFVSKPALSQEKIMTKTGKITFEASVPAFEEVKAKTETATCILKTATGEIACLALQKSFKFKLALMEEHYNENYMESDKFPKATFKGKIEDFNASALTATAKEYTVKGTLELHGKTKDVTTTAKIRKTDAGTEIITSFKVNSDDFGIEIPSVVKSKVSKTVSINAEFTLK